MKKFLLLLTFVFIGAVLALLVAFFLGLMGSFVYWSFSPLQTILNDYVGLRLAAMFGGCVGLGAFGFYWAIER